MSDKRLYARLAVANPKTNRISLSREFIEVSEKDVSKMPLPDHVVRVDLFENKEQEKPKRRIILGVEKVYSAADIENEFGPHFSAQLAESGATEAGFIGTFSKLVPLLPGDELVRR
jgi:hypothetical protein